MTFLCLLVCIVAQLGFISTLDAQDLLRVGVYQNHPGVFTDTDGKVKGFYIDILEETAKKENWALKYVPGSWAENMENLESGQIDVLVAIAYTRERDKYFDYTTETVFSNWGQVYVKDLKYQSVLDLKGMKIAGLKGDIYTTGLGSLLRRFGLSFQQVDVSEYSAALQRVADGEAEAAIISRSNGLAIEKDYDVFRSPIICCPMEIRYAVPDHKNKKIIDALDRHVKRLKMDKRSLYYRSLSQWFGRGSEKEVIPDWLLWVLAVATGLVVLLAGGGWVIEQQRVKVKAELQQTYGTLLKQSEEKRKMEIQMLATSKLATLGEVATGVAHEINQPLAYINSVFQQVEMEIDSGHVRMDWLEKSTQTSLAQIERIDNIIQHLQTFGRKDEVDGKSSFENFEIKTVVENTLLFLGERIKLRNIELVKLFDDNVPSVLGKFTRMEQVFVNLFQNAIHALKEKEDAQITVIIRSLAEQKQVHVAFTDNGAGMDQDTVEKIFEPFFTTKGVGEGTGLGLSIVYGIVQEHGGTISCDSNVGQGTTFTLIFPERGLV